jgi:3-deoxy-D-arabino-heptulosonate 7-phosphate (DAHP) synthase
MFFRSAILRFKVYSRNTVHLQVVAKSALSVAAKSALSVAAKSALSVTAKSALSVGACQIIIRETPNMNYSG